MKTLFLHTIIFLIFVKIGAVSFGGAYSIWSLVDQEFVQNPLGLLPFALPEASLYRFMEIGRMTPGPNINGVLLVGNHYLGLWGIPLVFVALLLPSVAVILSLYRLNQKFGLNQKFDHFKKGALASVIGIFVFFIYKLFEQTPHEDFWQVLWFWGFVGFLFVLIHVKKVNVILATLYSGLVTWSFYFFW